MATGEKGQKLVRPHDVSGRIHGAESIAIPVEHQAQIRFLFLHGSAKVGIVFRVHRVRKVHGKGTRGIAVYGNNGHVQLFKKWENKIGSGTVSRVHHKVKVFHVRVLGKGGKVGRFQVAHLNRSFFLDFFRHLQEEVLDRLHFLSSDALRAVNEFGAVVLRRVVRGGDGATG